MEREKSGLKGLIEALLFLSGEPLKLASIAKSVECEKHEAREILDELILDYQERDGGFVLREIAGAYQFATNERFSEILGKLFKEKKGTSYHAPV